MCISAIKEQIVNAASSVARSYYKKQIIWVTEIDKIQTASPKVPSMFYLYLNRNRNTT